MYVYTLCNCAREYVEALSYLLWICVSSLNASIYGCAILTEFRFRKKLFQKILEKKTSMSSPCSSNGNKVRIDEILYSPDFTFNMNLYWNYIIMLRIRKITKLGFFRLLGRRNPNFVYAEDANTIFRLSIRRNTTFSSYHHTKNLFV
jgi:hypothetical protein